MSKQIFQAPRGTNDILPNEQIYWQFLRTTIEKVLIGLSISRIDTPHFENVEIFNKSVGQNSDVVSKEMFYLSQREDTDENNHFALRPEGTAGVARAYIENGMSSWPQPVRLYYFGSMFRYERPQKGRLREFNQLGIEIFGDGSPKSDYLVIMAAWQILSKLGLKNIKVYANSIGCPNCRPKYINKLKKYYKNKIESLCPDCQIRYVKNPLRLLDCKEPKCQKIANGAPTILDTICKICRDHFQNTLEYLDYFNIRYDLDPTLVRGFDYYSNTVFEIADKDDKSRQSVLCGGGRYDGLIELFGGSKTPAVGCALGMERIVRLMHDQKIKPPKQRSVEICILELGEKAKTVCKRIFDQLSVNDINVYFVPSNDGLRQQIRTAVKLGAKYAVIIGQREAFKDEIILRDLEASSQEVFPQSKLVKEIKRRFDECFKLKTPKK